ncbi:MAG: hypothetical protein ABI599_10570 [Flavobacteriales bacterium]
MSELLDIYLQENGKGGHEDLGFQVHGLTADRVFDSYYFALAVEPLDTIEAVRECLAQYLEQWGRSIERMGDGEARILPIDLSDQYTGCLSVIEDGQSLSLEYGISMTEGWAISVNKPEQHFCGVRDFRVDTPEPLVVDKTFFLRSLFQCSKRLRGL